MKKTIKDYELDNKKVIIRCDLNIPMENGNITDDTKIKESLKTIEYAVNNNAKVIIFSHLGKVKTEEDKIKNDLYPVAVRLSRLLNQEVLFSKETRGHSLTEMVNNLKCREILLVQNTRYEDISGKLESNCDEELSKYWAGLGDIFISDAYGSAHRAHASNVGIAKYIPSAIGFLVEKEINKLNEILNEDTHPFIVIMGGKKVEDKIPVIESLITKCDKLIIGGGMAYTFLKSMGYNVGCSIVDNNSLEFCKEMINHYQNKIILPLDIVVGTSIEDNNQKVRQINEIKDDEAGFDIGPSTITMFCSELKDAKRVIINGPLGVFEKEAYINGTKKIYEYLINHNIKTLIGGGDTAASANKLNVSDKFYHVSTGGGATLEYLEGKELPGISVISNG